MVRSALQSCKIRLPNWPIRLPHCQPIRLPNWVVELADYSKVLKLTCWVRGTNSSTLDFLTLNRPNLFHRVVTERKHHTAAKNNRGRKASQITHEVFRLIIFCFRVKGLGLTREVFRLIVFLLGSRGWAWFFLGSRVWV